MPETLHAPEPETVSLHPDALPADPAARVRLAARTLSAAMLDVLAADADVTVRAAVALNPQLAQAGNGRLVRDPDERVRMLLAGKLARLLPGLSARDRAAAQEHVHGLLRLLAADTALKVRAALSTALAAMPGVPRDVVLRLAIDPECAVSDPMLRMSPILTDSDLLLLLATPPHPGAALTVAARPGLGSAVADVLAAHADGAVVRALLSNPAATIQEATLDALAGSAGDHPDWHEPLVHRPWLPAGALRSLSRLVVGSLLERLAARPDLPEGLAVELTDRMGAALEVPEPISEAAVLDAVRRMAQAGELTEDRLLEAAVAGDHRSAAAILAVAAGVPLATIDRAVALRSAKGLVSLVRRASFSMRAGSLVQSMLGRLGPDEVLAPAADGGFPLGPGEMDWQIELLHEPGR